MATYNKIKRDCPSGQPRNSINFTIKPTTDIKDDTGHKSIFEAKT